MSTMVQTANDATTSDMLSVVHTKLHLGLNTSLSKVPGDGDAIPIYGELRPVGPGGITPTMAL